MAITVLYHCFSCKTDVKLNGRFGDSRPVSCPGNDVISDDDVLSKRNVGPTSTPTVALVEMSPNVAADVRKFSATLSSSSLSSRCSTLFNVVDCCDSLDVVDDINVVALVVVDLGTML